MAVRKPRLSTKIDYNSSYHLKWVIKLDQKGFETLNSISLKRWKISYLFYFAFETKTSLEIFQKLDPILIRAKNASVHFFMLLPPINPTVDRPEEEGGAW